MDKALSGKGEKEVFEMVVAQIKGAKDIRPSLEKQITELSAKIEGIQKNIAMAYADKLNGVITEADFLSFKGVFEDEKLSCINKKERLEDELTANETHQKTQGNLNALPQKYKVIDTLTREVVNDFIETILVGEKDPATREQEITIHWSF